MVTKRLFTTGTRLNLSKKQLKYFKADIEKQSRLFRIVWKLIQTSNLKQPQLNTHLQDTYNIDKRTANTLIQLAKGRLKALKALKDVERAELRNKIGSFEAQIASLKTIVERQKEDAANNKLDENQLAAYRGNKDKLWQKGQKLNRMKQRLKKMDGMLKKPVLPLCWGGKKAFKAQHRLKENGFKSHEAWKNWYRKKRDGQINYVGSVGEPHGNQNSQLHYNEGAGAFSLKIRKDLGLMETTDDKFFFLDSLDFKYQREKMIGIIQSNNTPLTTRILRRGTKWYLQIVFTWAAELESIQTNLLYGAIGIDYNDGFIELSETDYYGNLVSQTHVPLNYHGTGNRAKTEVEQKISVLIKQASEKQKPIVVEDLDFKKTKAKILPGSNRQYNKMLHAFDYSRYKDTLENAAFRNNVGLIYVNPAYTTKIGISKYQNQKKLNRHQAASYVIARKGQGYSDTV